MRFLTSGFLKIKSTSAGHLNHLQICLEYKVNIMDSAEQSDFCLEAIRKSICFQFFLPSSATEMDTFLPLVHTP